jgi:phi13 family phage major tail protein
MSTKIGVDGLAYAKMTNEGSILLAPTYGAIRTAPGVMSLNINPNGAQETLFADNGPMETAATLGKIEVEIKKNQLTIVNKSELLGHQIDAKGGLVSGDADVPPFVAIGFRSLNSDGGYRYVWMYKGKFMDPEDQNETKGDSINFQPDTIKGQFLRIDKPYTINGKTTKPWKYEMDDNTSFADDTTLDAWFDSVVMPTSDTDSVNQTISATVATGATSSGNITVGIKAADLNSGTRVDLTVAVTADDTAAVVASKIRAACMLDALVYAFFGVSGTGAEVQLRALAADTTDSTMAITLQSAGATGVTFAA